MVTWMDMLLIVGAIGFLFVVVFAIVAIWAAVTDTLNYMLDKIENPW